MNEWPFARLLSPRPIVERLQRRIADLTEEEMLWEPVPACVTVRAVDGRWARDEPHAGLREFGDGNDPVATIGWRLAHIAGDALSGVRNPAWLGIDDADPPPGQALATVDGMREWLENAIDWWCALIEGCDDDHLRQPMGAIAGMWGDGPRAGFLVHIYTEVTHHTGEVGVLRDLWRAGLR